MAMAFYKKLYFFLYWKLFRVEWNARWGRFIPLRLDDNGELFVGIGAECLVARWWAPPFIRLLETQFWPHRWRGNGKRIGFVSRIVGAIGKEI